MYVKAIMITIMMINHYNDNNNNNNKDFAHHEICIIL